MIMTRSALAAGGDLHGMPVRSATARTYPTGATIK
jgi:hypothetical protein